VTQKQRAAKGVAILADKDGQRKESYVYINERIITIRFRIPRNHVTVVGVYSPEEGKKEETQQFCEQLQNEIIK
jgi:exonuclease III